VPSAEALDIIVKGAERIVQVSDAEVEEAMRAYYTDTHQLAEGAGAVPLAGLMQERERMKGRKVAVILSGGNIDRPVYARIIAHDRAQDRTSAPTPDRS
jgi:threonine dehydratase